MWVRSDFDRMTVCFSCAEAAQNQVLQSIRHVCESRCGRILQRGFQWAAVAVELSGAVILHEMPNAATLVGGGITLAGVLLFNYGAEWFEKRHRPLDSQ